MSAAPEYDYIIVGAGSAGCVLASRLTEDGRTRVLLLEAGPRDSDPWIHVPLGYGKLFARTDVNWAYESEPEPALNGRLRVRGAAGLRVIDASAMPAVPSGNINAAVIALAEKGADLVREDTTRA